MTNPQHPAYTLLADKNVEGRRIEITEVQPDTEEPGFVHGRLIDDSPKPKSPISFSITLGDKEYSNPTMIKDVIEGLADGVKNGESRIVIEFA